MIATTFARLKGFITSNSYYLDNYLFLRFSLCPESNDIPEVNDIDWQGLFRFASEQAIVGVVFKGISRLSEKGVKPPFQELMRWIGTHEQIVNQNKLVNNNVVKLVEEFKREGFDSCLLKGQGNNLFYPDVYERTPGDIDLWVTPLKKVSSEKERQVNVLKFLRKKYPKGNLHYNHIDAGVYNGTSVEIHHRPRFLNNMIHNRRLQQWIQAKREEQFGNTVRLPETDVDIAIPTWEFDVVFQLAHIYGHVLQSGIGFRHVVDYYYLLKVNVESLKVKDVQNTLRYLGLEKIAGAMMWLLHEKLGLPEEYLIAAMDERRGKVLLEEIMRGGNFGNYDKNNIKATSRLKKNILRVKRDFRMMRYFPSECLWEPVFRVYHLFWRMRYN